ncbi:MacS family sensor histidine kinase [Spirillospora sp. NPDC048911]|uniref:MacS family sensor histidine kinase n=1 Tax=Spirillospora sp. NPDC048911 TaxID=3364527 RepID=UPI003717A87E
MGLETALWRAVTVYRFVALIYAAITISINFDTYKHPSGGWIVLGVMIAWTAFATYAYSDESRRGRPLLVADLAVAAGCLLATAWVETDVNLSLGHPTLPVSWVAASVLAWAVVGGIRFGITAALILGTAGVSVHVIARSRTGLNQGSTINGIVLLFMAGLVVGHVVKLARDAEARLARAVELESATRERERLARRIHDSVLQVLAMVQKRGNEMGGEAAELGRLAGEQEAALRALIGAGLGAPPPVRARSAAVAGEPVDLRPVLTGHSSTTVTVSTPATPVLLPENAAAELGSAVAAALDNVRRHGGDGVRAWVLLEDGPGPGEVTVSVRDDGPGMEPGRLAQAAADGRLGVAQSIQGRVRDLGGTVSIITAPGEGTEIEMTIPSSG